MARTLDKHTVSTACIIYHFPGHGSFTAMTASPSRSAPKPEGNNANDALYWKLPLVKNHLLATSFITLNKEFCMFMHSTQYTNVISKHNSC
jgi:hypothetical protein